MTVCHLDIETYSTCDLKSAGVFKYAEDASTEILCAAYRFDNGPAHLWIPYNNLALESTNHLIERVRDKAIVHFNPNVPEPLEQHILSGGEVRAHNAQFERVVLNGVAGEKLGFPKLEIDQMVCTAIKAAACGLPRALADACKATGSHAKDDAGRISMMQVVKPKKASKKDPSTRYTPESAPDKFIDLYCYNVDDVLAEADLDSKVPDLPPGEQEMYIIDQLMNEKGIAVDLPAIANILAVVAEYKVFLERACEKATRPEEFGDMAWLDTDMAPTGLKPTQRDKIAEWIRANGYPQLVDMQAETVKALLKDAAVPDNVKHVLRIYSTYNAKAITKYDAILDAVCADGRLRGMFLMNGANTGRWSSLIVQLQNLFRPVIDDPETAVDAFSARSLEWIKSLWPDVDPIKVAASCVRSVLIAPPEKELIFADYAGIESRANAWLWGEEWKLEAFRAYDAGTGPDLYKIAYSRAFRVPIDSVTKAQRQIGKVMELALGYEGGVGAFVTMTETYGIKLAELAEQVNPVLPDDARNSAQWMWEKFGKRSGLPYEQFIACDGLKYLWRQAHPKIAAGWKALKQAAENAVEHRGQAFIVEGSEGRIMFKVVEYGDLWWLCMRLPDGHKLWYFKPEWIPPQEIEVQEVNQYTGATETVLKTIPGEIRYWGIDTKTRQYTRTTTYGGKLDENGIQGICARILRHAKRRLSLRKQLALNGSVHDEPLAEAVPGAVTDEEVRSDMCDGIAWAPGLPLAVEINRGGRYKK